MSVRQRDFFMEAPKVVPFHMIFVLLLSIKKDEMSISSQLLPIWLALERPGELLSLPRALEFLTCPWGL
jgi:hypothetical protein